MLYLYLINNLWYTAPVLVDSSMDLMPPSVRTGGQVYELVDSHLCWLMPPIWTGGLFPVWTGRLTSKVLVDSPSLDWCTVLPPAWTGEFSPGTDCWALFRLDLWTTSCMDCWAPFCIDWWIPCCRLGVLPCGFTCRHGVICTTNFLLQYLDC